MNAVEVNENAPQVLAEDEVFNPSSTYLAIETPLDRLFAEHHAMKSEIERLAERMAGGFGGALYYFLNAEKVASGRHCSMPDFEVGPAVNALDAEYWSKAVKLTDVLDVMPAGTRLEWAEQIQKHSTPPFEEETVRETLRTLITDRGRYFAERVDGVFRALSSSHVTNAPQGFGKRMIIANVLDQYRYENYQQCAYVEDLRRVIARFMGRDESVARDTSRDIGAMVRANEFGVWKSFDGGAFRLRIYRVGTAHVEVHPLISYRLNQVLASLYPLAIPPEHRTAPKKIPKEFELDYVLVSASTIQFLRSLRFEPDRRRIWSREIPGKEALRVLEALGGVSAQKGNRSFCFEYDPMQAIQHVLRTGQLPTEVSHQFYPTPDDVVDRLIAMADVTCGMTVLEPSAGTGNIAKRFASSQVTCVEISALHAEILKGHGFEVHCADFLVWEGTRVFDRIVMNPPFSQGRAALHVQRAAQWLGPEGRLLAVLPASMNGKEVVSGMQHEWTEPIRGQFGGANVTVVILCLSR